jgi:hypothetical protein
MEVQTMKMISKQIIIRGEASKTAGGVSCPGRQSIPQPYDPLRDLELLESVGLMEERYGIREEGLF